MRPLQGSCRDEEEFVLLRYRRPPRGRGEDWTPEDADPARPLRRPNAGGRRNGSRNAARKGTAKRHRATGNPARAWILGVLMGSGVLAIAGLGLAVYLQTLPPDQRVAGGDPAPASPSAPFSAANRSDANLPRWSPDPAAVAQLGESVGLDHFRLRQPPGYAARPKVVGTRHSLSLKGPQRPGRGSPALILELRPLEAREKEMSLEQVLEGELTFFKNVQAATLPNMTHTAIERGQLNGMTFVRSRFTSDSPRPGEKAHGLMYLSVQDQTVVSVTALDGEPESKTTLKLLEASAQTLQRSEP